MSNNSPPQRSYADAAAQPVPAGLSNNAPPAERQGRLLRVLGNPPKRPSNPPKRSSDPPKRSSETRRRSGKPKRSSGRNRKGSEVQRQLVITAFTNAANATRAASTAAAAAAANQPPAPNAPVAPTEAPLDPSTAEPAELAAPADPPVEVARTTLAAYLKAFQRNTAPRSHLNRPDVTRIAHPKPTVAPINFLNLRTTPVPLCTLCFSNLHGQTVSSHSRCTTLSTHNMTCLEYNERLQQQRPPSPPRDQERDDLEQGIHLSLLQQEQEALQRRHQPRSEDDELQCALRLSRNMYERHAPSLRLYYHKMSELAARRSMSFCMIPADGNCLMTAFLRAVETSGFYIFRNDEQPQIRREIADYMRAEANGALRTLSDAPPLDDGLTFAGFVDAFEHGDGIVWGEERVLRTLVTMTKVCVVLHRFAKDDYTRATFYPFVDAMVARQRKRVIHLVFRSLQGLPDHYDCLLPLPEQRELDSTNDAEHLQRIRSAHEEIQRSALSAPQHDVSDEEDDPTIEEVSLQEFVERVSPASLPVPTPFRCELKKVPTDLASVKKYGIMADLDEFNILSDDFEVLIGRHPLSLHMHQQPRPSNSFGMRGVAKTAMVILDNGKKCKVSDCKYLLLGTVVNYFDLLMVFHPRSRARALHGEEFEDDENEDENEEQLARARAGDIELPPTLVELIRSQVIIPALSTMPPNCTKEESILFGVYSGLSVEQLNSFVFQDKHNMIALDERFVPLYCRSFSQLLDAFLSSAILDQAAAQFLALHNISFVVTASGQKHLLWSTTLDQVDALSEEDMAGFPWMNAFDERLITYATFAIALSLYDPSGGHSATFWTDDAVHVVGRKGCNRYGVFGSRTICNAQGKGKPNVTRHANPMLVDFLFWQCYSTTAYQLRTFGRTPFSESPMTKFASVPHTAAPLNEADMPAPYHRLFLDFTAGNFFRMVDGVSFENNTHTARLEVCMGASEAGFETIFATSKHLAKCVQGMFESRRETDPPLVVSYPSPLIHRYFSLTIGQWLNIAKRLLAPVIHTFSGAQPGELYRGALTLAQSDTLGFVESMLNFLVHGNVRDRPNRLCAMLSIDQLARKYDRLVFPGNKFDTLSCSFRISANARHNAVAPLMLSEDAFDQMSLKGVVVEAVDETRDIPHMHYVLKRILPFLGLGGTPGYKLRFPFYLATLQLLEKRLSVFREIATASQDSVSIDFRSYLVGEGPRLHQRHFGSDPYESARRIVLQYPVLQDIARDFAQQFAIDCMNRLIGKAQQRFERFVFFRQVVSALHVISAAIDDDSLRHRTAGEFKQDIFHALAYPTEYSVAELMNAINPGDFLSLSFVEVVNTLMALSVHQTHRFIGFNVITQDTRTSQEQAIHHFLEFGVPASFELRDGVFVRTDESDLQRRVSSYCSQWTNYITSLFSNLFNTVFPCLENSHGIFVSYQNEATRGFNAEEYAFYSEEKDRRRQRASVALTEAILSLAIERYIGWTFYSTPTQWCHHADRINVLNAEIHASWNLIPALELLRSLLVTPDDASIDQAFRERLFEQRLIPEAHRPDMMVLPLSALIDRRDVPHRADIGIQLSTNEENETLAALTEMFDDPTNEDEAEVANLSDCDNEPAQPPAAQPPALMPLAAQANSSRASSLVVVVSDDEDEEASSVPKTPPPKRRQEALSPVSPVTDATNRLRELAIIVRRPPSSSPKAKQPKQRRVIVNGHGFPVKSPRKVESIADGVNRMINEYITVLEKVRPTIRQSLPRDITHYDPDSNPAHSYFDTINWLTAFDEEPSDAKKAFVIATAFKHMIARHALENDANLIVTAVTKPIRRNFNRENITVDILCNIEYDNEERLFFREHYIGRTGVIRTPMQARFKTEE